MKNQKTTYGNNFKLIFLTNNFSVFEANENLILKGVYRLNLHNLIFYENHYQFKTYNTHDFSTSKIIALEFFRSRAKQSFGQSQT